MPVDDPFLEFLGRRDRRSYTRFVTSYVDLVSRLARRVVGREDLAHDVVQDTFLKLARSRLRPGGIRSPRAYVGRVVLNVGRKLLRDASCRRRHEREAARRRPSEQAGADAELLGAEELERLHGAIASLPEELRIALHLRALEGFSYEEIATATECCVDTVSSRLHRARDLVKRRLGHSAGVAALWAALRDGRSAEILPRSPAELEPLLRSLQLANRFRFLLRAISWILGGGLLLTLPSGEAGSPLPVVADATVSVLPVGLGARPPRPRARGFQQVHGGTTMHRRLAGLASTATLALSVTAGLGKEPGDLLSVVPSSIRGPMDLARDEAAGSYWVSSFEEHVLFELGADLREILRTVELPFSHPFYSQARGLAVNPIEGTLLVADSKTRRVYELRKDGEATGRVFSVPSFFADEELRGMSFDEKANDGDGLLYAILNGPGPSRPGLVYEITPDGEVLRSFPPEDDVGIANMREGGLEFQDIEPFYEQEELAGFYLLVRHASRNLILELGPDGATTSASLTLAEIGEEVNGILRRPYVVDGREEDSYVAAGAIGSRFVVWKGGEPVLPDIRDLSGLVCESTGGGLRLGWTRGQVYDRIELRSGCELLADLRGDADDWSFDEPVVEGVHELTIQGVRGPVLTKPETCRLLVGPGETLKMSPLASGPWVYPALSVGPDGEIVVGSNTGLLYFFDRDLTPLKSSGVGEPFLQSPEELAGVAHGEGGTLYVLNGRRYTIAQFDSDSMRLRRSFALDLPIVGNGPGDAWLRGAVRGLAYDPGGNAGMGSLWLTEARSASIFEIDLSGRVLRRFSHPYRALEHPSIPAPFQEIHGVSVLRNGDTLEVFSSARIEGTNRQDILSLDPSSGEFSEALEIPLDPSPGPLAAFDFAGLRESGRLIAVSRKDLLELDASPAPIAPPGVLLCRRGTLEDAVELDFENHGPYDSVEVYRACERIAELPGDASSYVDVGVPDGATQYRVRGIRGGQASAFAHCRVLVGPGAILRRRGLVDAYDKFEPYQITRDPTSGSFLVINRADVGASEILQLDADFNLMRSRAPSVEGKIQTLAVRVDGTGNALLYSIVDNSDSFYLAIESVDGEFIDSFELDPVRNAWGRSRPVGLSWDPSTDSFFYLEEISETIAEIDPEGRLLRSFANPAASPARVRNTGLAVAPDRGSLLVTSISTEEWSAPVDGCAAPCPVVGKVMELSRDGSLTGQELPLPREQGVEVAGIVLRGDELLALGREVLVLQAFSGPRLPERAFFLRGDANDNGKLDMSDPIAVLSYQFLGTFQPPCLDACDFDDSGTVELADAVASLAFQFLGDAAPAPPFPTPGQDPTEDVLESCRDLR